MENDLISRAKVAETIRALHINFGGCDMFTDEVKGAVLHMIGLIPNIEAEPVRHGRWIRVDMFKSLECSECGALERHNCFDYCHCGAKMDKEVLK